MIDIALGKGSEFVCDSNSKIGEAWEDGVRDSAGSNFVNTVPGHEVAAGVAKEVGSQGSKCSDQRNNRGDVVNEYPGCAKVNVNKKDGGDGEANVEDDDDGRVSTKSEGDETDTESNGERGIGGNVDGEDLDLHAVNNKLINLDCKSGDIEKTFSQLKISLECSQNEIDDLKKENSRLCGKLTSNELEGERTQFKVNRVEEKVERLETVVKKKNLSIEGLPDVRDGRENIEKSIWEVLDQLNMLRGIELDSCYRLGPYNKNHNRPVVISFVKQADRDLVYSRRMELKNSADYKNTWINEDLGPASKRKRNMMRLIAKQAKIQGIDHRTGKYAIHIGKEKFEEGNLDELPPPLHPTSIKQVQIDRDVL